MRKTTNKPLMKFGLRAVTLTRDLPNVKQALRSFQKIVTFGDVIYVG
jgi:hypothetical protein